MNCGTSKTTRILGELDAARLHDLCLARRHFEHLVELISSSFFAWGRRAGSAGIDAVHVVKLAEVAFTAAASGLAGGAAATAELGDALVLVSPWKPATMQMKRRRVLLECFGVGRKFAFVWTPSGRCRLRTGEEMAFLPSALMPSRDAMVVCSPVAGARPSRAPRDSANIRVRA